MFICRSLSNQFIWVDMLPKEFKQNNQTREQLKTQVGFSEEKHITVSMTCLVNFAEDFNGCTSQECVHCYLPRSASKKLLK